MSIKMDGLYYYSAYYANTRVVWTEKAFLKAPFICFATALHSGGVCRIRKPLHRPYCQYVARLSVSQTSTEFDFVMWGEDCLHLDALGGGAKWNRESRELVFEMNMALKESKGFSASLTVTAGL